MSIHDACLFKDFIPLSIFDLLVSFKVISKTRLSLRCYVERFSSKPQANQYSIIPTRTRLPLGANAADGYLSDAQFTQKQSPMVCS
jgi:hypothetical protein